MFSLKQLLSMHNADWQKRIVTEPLLPCTITTATVPKCVGQTIFLNLLAQLPIQWIVCHTRKQISRLHYSSLHVANNVCYFTSQIQCNKSGYRSKELCLLIFHPSSFVCQRHGGSKRCSSCVCLFLGCFNMIISDRNRYKETVLNNGKASFMANICLLVQKQNGVSSYYFCGYY